MTDQNTQTCSKHEELYNYGKMGTSLFSVQGLHVFCFRCSALALWRRVTHYHVFGELHLVSIALCM